MRLMEKNVIAIILGSINGGIALVAVLSLLAWDVLLGSIFLIFPILVIIGVALILSESYKAGAILCAVGGAATIPIGILGVFAAKFAWSYQKEFKETTLHAAPFPVQPYTNQKVIEAAPLQYINVKCPRCGTVFATENIGGSREIRCPQCGVKSLLR